MVEADFVVPMMTSFAFVVVKVIVAVELVAVAVGAEARLGSKGETVLAPDTAIPIVLMLAEELIWVVMTSEDRGLGAIAQYVYTSSEPGVLEPRSFHDKPALSEKPEM